MATPKAMDKALTRDMVLILRRRLQKLVNEAASNGDNAGGTRVQVQTIHECAEAFNKLQELLAPFNMS